MLATPEGGRGCILYALPLTIEFIMFKKISVGIAGALFMFSPFVAAALSDGENNGTGSDSQNSELSMYSPEQLEQIQQLLALVQNLQQIVQNLLVQHGNPGNGGQSPQGTPGSGSEGGEDNDNQQYSVNTNSWNNPTISQGNNWYVNITSSAVGSPVNVAPGACSAPATSLAFGSSGSEVTKLQQFLSQQGLLESGNVTGTFGPLTEAAVKEFQSQNDIASEGDEGYGFVGPKTKAAISAVCGGNATAGTPDADTTPPVEQQGASPNTASGSGGGLTPWTANQCPTGTTGAYPNCVSIHGSCNIVNSTSCNGEGTGFDEGGYCTVGPVPGDWAVVNGRWLRCTPGAALQSNFTTTCSPNMTGTWPNCVHTTYSTCPDGSTGTYPSCVPSASGNENP